MRIFSARLQQVVVYENLTTECLFSSKDPTHLISGRKFVACKLPRCSSLCVSSGPLQKLNMMTNQKTVTHKGTRGRIRELVVHMRFQRQGFGREIFGYFCSVLACRTVLWQHQQLPNQRNHISKETFCPAVIFMLLEPKNTKEKTLWVT